MSRKLLLVTLVIATFGLSFIGCELDADKESDLLPQRNVGDSFKIFVDDIGPFDEIDESGNKTGRAGNYFDMDHNYYEGQDGSNVKDVFYQLNRPTAGIVALSFDADTGFATGGVPVAMAKLVPGEEHYEVPLESVTEWVKDEVAIGYVPAQYEGEKNMLVYYNRVTGEELDAPLTGKTAERSYDFVSLGTVSGSGGGTKSASNDDGDFFDEMLTSDGDVDPLAPGDASDQCGRFSDICAVEKDCGLFPSGWSTTDCKQTLFGLFEYGAREGSDYIRCLDGCSSSCSEFKSCKESCLTANMPDAYGCGGSYGPDVMDVFYVVERGEDRVFVDEGAVISGSDKLSIYVEYADAECNMEGGSLNVTVGTETVEFDLPSGVHCSSLEEGKMLGFTFENPLPAGDVQFTVSLTDGKLNGVKCGLEGDMTYTGSFTVEDPDSGNDTSASENFSRVFQYFEILADHLTKYTIGTGFIDAAALGKDVFVDFEDYDMGIIQGYLWTYLGTYDLPFATITELNNLIFTTTSSTRETKYDTTDDIQSWAFYLDQPVPSGAFLFYGDTGWNLYPKGPSNDNEDQVFLRGDFETTEIYFPTDPYYTVDTKYTGCSDACDWLVNRAYDYYHLTFPGFDTPEEALEACRGDYRDDYWSCRADCFNLADTGLNGCISLDSCLDDCTNSLSSGNQSFCDGADDISIKVHLNIPDEYLNNCVYKKLIFDPEAPEVADCTYTPREIEDWQPLRIGAWNNNGIGAAYVDLAWPQTEYEISLPFGPKMQKSILSGQPGGMVQAQMYLTIYDGSSIFGTSFNPPNDTNDDYFAWLLIYGYNWVSPEMEGWTLSTVAGNSITGYANIRGPVIEMNFGDLRALVSNEDDAFLDPNATSL